jgi:hypothetical protein
VRSRLPERTEEPGPLVEAAGTTQVREFTWFGWDLQRVYGNRVNINRLSVVVLQNELLIGRDATGFFR